MGRRSQHEADPPRSTYRGCHPARAYMTGPTYTRARSAVVQGMVVGSQIDTLRIVRHGMLIVAVGRVGSRPPPTLAECVTRAFTIQLLTARLHTHNVFDNLACAYRLQ